MKGTMKTAVMLGIGKMGFEEREIPQVKEDEVLVKLECVGICGSDLHYYESGAIGDYVVKPPFVLGHEPGGTVVEVGRNVKHLKAIVSSVRPGAITFARMWYFSQRLRWTGYSRSMWHMKRSCASSFRTT